MKRNIIFTAIAVCLALILPGILGGIFTQKDAVESKAQQLNEQKMHMNKLLNNATDTMVVAQPIY